MLIGGSGRNTRLKNNGTNSDRNYRNIVVYRGCELDSGVVGFCGCRYSFPSDFRCRFARGRRMSAVSIISLIFSGVMLVVSIVNFFIANIRQAKQNSADAEHELASLREVFLKRT